MLARNHPRSTNLNPNDNPKRIRRLLRWAAWSVLIHPVGVGLFVFCVWLGEPLAGLVLLLLEVLMLMANPGFLPEKVRTWNNAMRFRRRFHHTWTTIVAAPYDTTSFLGGLLPVLSVVPTITGTSARFRLRAPQGETLLFVEQLAIKLASQYQRVSHVIVEYRRDTDSIGDMIVVFGDPLAQTLHPVSDEPALPGLPTPGEQPVHRQHLNHPVEDPVMAYLNQQGPHQ